METNVERTREVWWWWAGLGAGLPGERLSLQNGHGIVLSLDFSPFPAVFSSEIPSAGVALKFLLRYHAQCFTVLCPLWV